MTYSFPLYNVTICDFCEVFNTQIVPEFNKLCKEYNITDLDTSAKRLLTHAIIKTCCDIAMQLREGSIVFFYNKQCIQWNGDLKTEISELVYKIIQQCIKSLPISWYCSSKPLTYYIGLIENHQGSSFLLQLNSKSTKNSYTFSKALKYIQKNKLNFLNDQYFSCLKTRCLLINT